MKRTPMKSRHRSTGPTPDVVDAVYERAGHSCEVCTEAVRDRRGVDHHIHHRRPRGNGGSRRSDTNQPPNLLLLCPECHEQIESHRDIARSMGWLLTQTQDPVRVRVLVQRDRWVFLTTDGRYAASIEGIVIDG